MDGAQPLAREGDALFQARLFQKEDGLRLEFCGTLSHENPQAVLDPLLVRVHRTAIEHRVGRVTVDFVQLDFMNSAAFKSFITWLNLVQSEPQASRYRVRFSITSARRWQSTSIHALSCFALGLVESVIAA